MDMPYQDQPVSMVGYTIVQFFEEQRKNLATLASSDDLEALKWSSQRYFVDLRMQLDILSTIQYIKSIKL